MTQPHELQQRPVTQHPVAADCARPPSQSSATASPIKRMRLAVNTRMISMEGPIHAWLVEHSVTILRISLGLVFLAFGLLKYFPGLSPAENLSLTTTKLLTFGVVGGVIPDYAGLVLIATLECVIGLSLITTVWLRLTLYLLVIQLIGIMSPLVLLPQRLFAGPDHAPTLEGQYVLKDIILVAAAMVVATGFRGAKIRYPSPRRHSQPDHGHRCADG